MLKSYKIFYLLLFALLCCRKPYNPPAVKNNNNYLVVEGVINTGTDSTSFKLSRTINLSAGIAANPETGAMVTVESNANTSYPLTETKPGYYTSAGLNLDMTKQYRLQITTTDNQQYLSDFVAVKPTPPIDSVGYIVQSNGIQLYVNTHDPNNNTHYYRWDYTETWNFHAQYETAFITNGKTLQLRTPAQQIFTCFANDTASTITLGSTAKLSKDIVLQQPITQVVSTSEKIETKYSILVRQYALTNDAYSWWTFLKKNTEQLGSIFDAQPSTVRGNIHCTTNPSEPVIGYISVTNVQQKRIFITNAQLPQAWMPVYPYQCQLDSALFCRGAACAQNDVALFILPLNPSEFALSPIITNGAFLGYVAADAQCTDCTIRGTTVQPPFWQ